MRYAIVLAFGAAALAQNITQSPAQPCVGVVTETVIEYTTVCPPCSTTNNVSGGLATTTTAAGIGSGSSSVAVGSNSNDGPILQSTTVSTPTSAPSGASSDGPIFQSTAVGTPTSAITGASTVGPSSGLSSTLSSTGSAQQNTSPGATSGAVTTTSVAPPVLSTSTTASVLTSSTTASAPPYDTSTVPDPELTRTGQVQTRPLSSIPNYDDYAQAILYAHNLHRKNASISLLSWNQQIADYAQQTANTCVYAHSNEAGKPPAGQTSPGYPYGQNIGAGFVVSGGTNQVPAMITNNMYDNEINNYPGPYGSNNVNTNNFGGWGHYSQIVWTSTTSVGCATAYCPNGLQGVGPNTPPYFTVCNYYPAGNYIGQWSQVAAPGGADTVVFTN